MQSMLKTSAAIFCLLSGLAWADSKLTDLPPATSPLADGSCLYVDQGPGVDTKLCSGFANALGLNTSAANTMRGNWTNSAGTDAANAMPSCPDTGNNHLNYVPGTGVICGTTAPSPIPSFARAFFSPSDPAGTASVSLVMMGLGSTATITPTSSGRVHIVVVGSIKNSANNGAVNARLAFGTGAAPANGAAATGTTLGATKATNAATNTEIQTFALEGYTTGLALSTAIWIDVQLSVGSGTGTITNVDIYAEEL